jgi:hypothetical protein
MNNSKEYFIIRKVYMIEPITRHYDKPSTVNTKLSRKKMNQYFRMYSILPDGQVLFYNEKKKRDTMRLFIIYLKKKLGLRFVTDFMNVQLVGVKHLALIMKKPLISYLESIGCKGYVIDPEKTVNEEFNDFIIELDRYKEEMNKGAEWGFFKDIKQYNPSMHDHYVNFSNAITNTL